MATLRRMNPTEWGRNKDIWDKGCSLYVIEEQHPGPVKVGIAEHPIRRLSILQCGNPRALFLRAIYCGTRADCRWIEGAIHFRFSGSILRGEWMSESVATVEAELEQFCERRPSMMELIQERVRE